MKKRILSMLLAVMMVITLLPVAAFATDNGTLPGARVETNDYGDVFLGGNYIEVGISKRGSFGTSRFPSSSGWHYQTGMWYDGIGLLSDEDGWNVGKTSQTGDFFMPGTPEERWILSYKIGGTTYEHMIADRNGGSIGSWKTAPTTVNDSDLSKGLLKAVVTGETDKNVKIEITYSFGVNDLFYVTDVTITNLGSSPIEDVRFVRSFDPDQDQKNTNVFKTYNKVICNPDYDKPGSDTNYAMVVARGGDTLSGFFFLTFDNRARASRNVGSATSNLIPSSAYLDALWDTAPVTANNYATEADIEMSKDNTNGYTLEDRPIALTFNIGDLDPNASTDLEYYSSLDPDVQDSLKSVLAGNVDYREEVLIGLVAGKTYHITCNGVTYIFNNISGTTIPLSGSTPTTGSNGAAVTYDFIGKTITIVEKNEFGEDASVEQDIVIAPRPGQGGSGESTPKYPAPVLEGITADSTSITIPAVATQEYSLNGIDWYTPTDPTFVFSGLEPGTLYTVYTRVAATDTYPVSETISATIKTHYLITVTTSSNGTTTVDKESAVLKEVVTITATPATGYKFVNWTKDGAVVSTNATYSFTATENAEYVANFEEYHTHCVCGATHAAIGTHITEENPTWIAISSASDFTKNKDSGYYYLTNDIEVSAKWDFTESRDIVLCLNGYDITYTGSSNVSFIPGSTALNFTLTDCQDDAGSISGFKNTYGGAINVKKAFTMYNGKITGNTANQGGGVYVDQNATFYMYGGEITGNTASTLGGGVFNKGSMEVAGAPVVNNNESSNTVTTYPSSMYKYTKNIYSSTGAIRVGTGGLATGALLDVTPMFPASSSEKPAAVAVIATGCTSDLSEYFTYTSGFDYIKQYDAAMGEVQLVYNPVKYTVTFDMQGHGTQIEPQEVETGTYALEPTPAPTAVGYQFGGWYTTPECGYWDDFIFDFFKITANTTLYAKWTEKATVSISEDVQAYTWDGNAKAFIISGNPDTNFVVQYKVNDNWTEAAPSAMGTYDVKITREEDTIYKAYEKMIGGGLVINAATPTVTVPTVEADLVYDGTSQSLIAEGTSENGHWEYSLDGTNYLTTVPAGTDAKTYIVYCNFVPNTGYTGVDPVELSVTIDPMAVDEPTVNDSYIYTGSKQTVTLNGFNDSYMTIAGNKETNAGDYEVVITLDSNHTWNTGSDGRVQWSIGKAEPTVTWPTGTAYVNDTSVTLTGGSAAGVGTETSVEGSFTLEAVDLTSAGTKTVKITFAPNSTNYKNVEKTDYSVTVSKRTVESVAEQTAVENAVYGTEQDALGLPASVEITVSGNKMFTVPVTWSGYDATNLNAQTLTGTLDLTDIAAEVQQPNPAITAAIVVDLQEKNAAAFSFENKTETYSGSPISHEISGGLDGVASISYSYESSEYAASSTAPTNAGVYEVTAIFTMEAGYASVAPKTATLTINPREVGLDWSALTGEELVYSGTAKALTATATGLADGDSCTVTVELVGDNVNAGTFSYKATALSNANYKLPPNISSPEYTITPKTLTITADDKEVYVGNDQPELTYTVEGLVGSDVLITAPTLSTDANMYQAGAYAITFANEAAAGNNYSITYVNGALTVKNHPYSPTITPIYDVKIADDITGGEVSASRKLAYKGTTITITIAPDAGYELAKLIVTDSRGNAVAVTKASDNTYTFKMPASKITVKAAFAVENPFEDVSSDAYYYDAVLWAVKVGITSGTGATTFSPDNPCTRAQMATFLWRAAGSPDPVSKTCIFADVPADAYYATAVQWAYEQGITSGISATTYSPDDPCTRGQMATFLWRNAGSPDPVSKTCIFADVPADAYYATAVQWAYEQGITSGTSATTFSPNDPCTRGQMVTFLYRYYVK